MGRGQAPASSPGGGARIQALRAPRPRLIAAAGSVIIAAALAGYPAVSEAQLHDLAIMGVVALAFLAVALAMSWSGGITWTLLILGAEDILSLYIRGILLDATAIVYGTGLLLVAELAYWSFEFRLPSRDVAGVASGRLLFTLVLVFGSLGLGMLGWVVAQAPLPGGLILTASGLAALACALILVTGLAWRMRA